jgi:hypothetical protein
MKAANKITNALQARKQPRLHVKSSFFAEDELRLFRHNGQELVPIEPTSFEGGKWLVSTVLPLAFRRKAFRRGPLTEIQRTDGTAGSWTV